MGNSILAKAYIFLENIYTRARGIFYLATSKNATYSCPFCNHSFDRFLAVGYPHTVLKEKKIIGGGYRKNAKCPFCASIDRERLVYLLIDSRNLLQPGMKMLHVAPEKNLQRVIREKGVDHFSADLDSYLAEIKMDITAIQFPDNYFDAIICNHVLEHIPDDLKAMKELHRVLKNNGWAILQVPYSPVMEKTFEDASVTSKEDRVKIFGQDNHVRIYGLDYPARLRSAGFSVTMEKMDTVVGGRFALNPEEVVFLCKKTA